MSNLELHQAIAAVCPIIGVAIGDPADKSTWRIDPAPEATKDQIAAGELVLQGFDMAKADSRATTCAALQANDIASVRALREWVAAQPGAPPLVIEREQAAQTLRTKLR